MPAEELRVAQQRIDRFKRLGGVELDPDDLALHHQVWGGTAHLKRAIFVFVCPMCGREERLDTEMEPVCTGPSWTDDHPMMVMQQVPQ